MPSAKRTAYVAKECVACGCCVKVCPKKAIYIPKGIRAEVERALCIGCGKCAVACPACVIELREVVDCEKEMV